MHKIQWDSEYIFLKLALLLLNDIFTTLQDKLVSK